MPVGIILLACAAMYMLYKRRRNVRRVEEAQSEEAQSEEAQSEEAQSG